MRKQKMRTTSSKTLRFVTYQDMIEKQRQRCWLPGPSTHKGTPHYEATQAQRSVGGGSYNAERKIAFIALRKAGIKKDDAKALIRNADEHFKSIDVTPQTPTRIPGNRRK